jgi:hypothetical protein
MKLAQCALTLLLLVRAVPAADPVLADLFPPDTKVAFGANVRHIAASALARSLQSQALSLPPGADWLKSVSLAGFDPLRDIEEVLVASSGVGPQPQALLVLSGRFDVARLAEGAPRYHGVPLPGGDKNATSLFALLDGATALAGDPALVRAAIDRREGGDHLNAVLAARIASLRQRYDVWGLGERPEGFVAPTPEVRQLETIDRFQFGLLLGSGLELTAELHARSPQDTEKLNASLAMVAAILKAQQPSANAAKFDLQADGDIVRFTMAISEEELTRAIRGETARAAAPVPAPKTAPKVPSKPPAAQVFDQEGNTVVLRLPGRK